MILKRKTKKGRNTKTFFAFLPVKCGSEIRWLEKVTIQYDVNGSEKLGYWVTSKKFIERHTCDFCHKTKLESQMTTDGHYWFCHPCWEDVKLMDTVILNDI